MLFCRMCHVRASAHEAVKDVSRETLALSAFVWVRQEGKGSDKGQAVISLLPRRLPGRQ